MTSLFWLHPCVTFCYFFVKHLCPFPIDIVFVCPRVQISIKTKINSQKIYQLKSHTGFLFLLCCFFIFIILVKVFFQFILCSFLSRFVRSSYRRCSIRKCVFRNLEKLTGKHLCQSLFFNKVAGWDSGTGVFLWILQNFKFLRTLFLQNTSGRLILFYVWKRTNLNKGKNIESSLKVLKNLLVNPVVTTVSECYYYSSLRPCKQPCLKSGTMLLTIYKKSLDGLDLLQTNSTL